MKYFSAATGGFYNPHPALHGPRKIEVPDPTWINPDPEDDPEAAAPFITIDNPNCKIPPDAVEISDEEHAALVEGQASAHMIEAGPDGRPVGVRKELSLAELRGVVFPEARRMREKVLNALTGLGFRALLKKAALEASEDPQDAAVAADALRLALEAAKAQEGLLDLTKDPRVLAVMPEQGLDRLRAEVMVAFREQMEAAPASLRGAYQEALQ